MSTMESPVASMPADLLLAALTATRLLGRWSLVCQRHGGGCSCCPGLGDIDMEEVERLLSLDLRKRHSLMQDREGFAELLKQCVSRSLQADQPALTALLEDIGHGIDELEKVQSGLY